MVGMIQSFQSTSIELIGETGFTHKGELDYLKKQIDIIAENRFDYVKFQVLLDVSEVYNKSANIYSDLKENIFSYETWCKVLDHAANQGLGILFMPVDYKSLSLVEEYSNVIDIIEVHAIALNDIHLLEHLNNLSSTGINAKYMLGIGGREASDIYFASDLLKNEKQILMYGFQNFPTMKKKTNLGKISTFSKNFDIPIGYADHTVWNEDDSELIQMALLLGATILEKHIILEEGDKSRPDYISAIDQNGINRLKDSINNCIAYYGSSDINSLTVDELKYKERERKIVTRRKLEKGKKLMHDDLCYKVTDASTSISPKMLKNIYGQIINKTLNKNSIIRLDDLS